MASKRPRPASILISTPSISDILDARYWLVASAAGLVSLVLYGLVAAIIPNPIFGRTIPADAAAILVWIISAPLVGMLAATYVIGVPSGVGRANAGAFRQDDSGSGAFTLGGLATFFAIGCPVCNKIVLLALGTSGAMTVFAPIQPLLGAASLVLLAATLVWRLRRRAQGCALPTAPG